MIQDKKIAVIGGGPGGLTLARLLQNKGCSVSVYERDESRNVRVQGATLDLHEDSGLKAIREAGLLDEFRKNFRPGADKMRVTDRNAKIMLDDHDEKPQEAFGSGHFRPEIDRGPLRDILLDSLKPGTVQWNSHVTALEKNESGWTICLKSGRKDHADIIIGADGANSKVRALVTPVKAFYSGITIVEGNVYGSEAAAPRLHELVKGGKVFALGDSKSLILSAKGDGSLSFYTGVKTPESWVKDSGIDFKNMKEVSQWFKKEYAAWDAVWHELFDNGNTYVIPRPQYCMPLDQSWEARADITLIGDAAHVMPPYAGEGVNMAMLDALELSEWLTDEQAGDLRSRISKFEAQMRERASESARMTLEVTGSLHSPDGLEQLLQMFRQH